MKGNGLVRLYLLFARDTVPPERVTTSGYNRYSCKSEDENEKEDDAK